MEKTITPHYTLRPTKNSVRKKLTGYIGQIVDGDTVIHSMEYSTYHDAEVALDALAFDLLQDMVRDLAQATYTDQPPFTPSTCCFCHKAHHPQKCPEMRAMLFAPEDDGNCPFCAHGAVPRPLCDAISLPLDVDFSPDALVCAACGIAATHHVSFADEPYNEYYCDTHIAGTFYISTDIRTEGISGPHDPVDIQTPLEVEFAPIGPEV